MDSETYSISETLTHMENELHTLNAHKPLPVHMCVFMNEQGKIYLTVFYNAKGSNMSFYHISNSDFCHLVSLNL